MLTPSKDQAYIYIYPAPGEDISGQGCVGSESFNKQTTTTEMQVFSVSPQFTLSITSMSNIIYLGSKHLECLLQYTDGVTLQKNHP